MIGTKVKVGWDASGVQRGMKGLIGTIGKGFGAIARGGLERIGHRMTDLMGRIIAAAPAAIKDLADYGGELSDLSAALEIPVDRLVELQEAMRLGGAGVDSLRMFAMMAKNIELANSEGGDLAKSLQEIGLRTDNMAALKPDEQFRAIAEAIQQSDLPVGKLIDVLSDIFGGRVGMKMLNLFRGFNANMDRASKNSRGFAKYMSTAAGGLDEMSDALGRWEMLRRGLASVVVGAFTDAFGTSGIDAMFDKMDPSGLRKWFSKAFSDALGFMQEEFEFFNFVGFGGYIKFYLTKAFDSAWEYFEGKSKEFGDWIYNSLTHAINRAAGDMLMIAAGMSGKGWEAGMKAGAGFVQGIKGAPKTIAEAFSGMIDESKNALTNAGASIGAGIIGEAIDGKSIWAKVFGESLANALGFAVGAFFVMAKTAVIELGKLFGGAAYGGFMEALGDKFDFFGKAVPEMQKGMRMNQSWSPANATTMTTQQASQLIALTKSIERKFGELATV